MDALGLVSGGSWADLDRITRACDPCHAMKSKCPGGYPCAACTKRQLSCTYSEPKKRGPKPQQKGSTPTPPSSVLSRSRTVGGPSTGVPSGASSSGGSGERSTGGRSSRDDSTANKLSHSSSHPPAMSTASSSMLPSGPLPPTSTGRPFGLAGGPPPLPQPPPHHMSMGHHHHMGGHPHMGPGGMHPGMSLLMAGHGHMGVPGMHPMHPMMHPYSSMGPGGGVTGGDGLAASLYGAYGPPPAPTFVSSPSLTPFLQHGPGVPSSIPELGMPRPRSAVGVGGHGEVGGGKRSGGQGPREPVTLPPAPGTEALDGDSSVTSVTAIRWVRLFFLFANPVLPMVCKTQFYYLLLKLGHYDVCASLCEDTRPVCVPHALVADMVSSNSGVGGSEGDAGSRMRRWAATVASTKALPVQASSYADVHDEEGGHRDCDCTTMTFAPLRKRDGSIWRLGGGEWGSGGSDGAGSEGGGSSHAGPSPSRGLEGSDRTGASEASIPVAMNVRAASMMGGGASFNEVQAKREDEVKARGGRAQGGGKRQRGESSTASAASHPGPTSSPAPSTSSSTTFGDEAIGLWVSQVHAQQLEALGFQGEAGTEEGGAGGRSGVPVSGPHLGALTLPSMLPPAAGLVHAGPELIEAHMAQLPPEERGGGGRRPDGQADAARAALWHAVLAVGARMDGNTEASDRQAERARQQLSLCFDSPTSLHTVSAAIVYAYWLVGMSGDADTRKARVYIAIANEIADSMEQVRRERVRLSHGGGGGGGGVGGSSADGPGAPPPVPVSFYSSAPPMDGYTPVVPLDILLTVRFLAQLTTSQRAGNATLAEAIRTAHRAVRTGGQPSTSMVAGEGGMTRSSTPTDGVPMATTATATSPSRAPAAAAGGGGAAALGDEWYTPRGRISRILAYCTGVTRLLAASPDTLRAVSGELLAALREADEIDRKHAPGGPMGHTVRMTTHVLRAAVLVAAQDSAGAREAANLALSSLSAHPLLMRLNPWITSTMLLQLTSVLCAAGMHERMGEVLQAISAIAAIWPIAQVVLSKAMARVATSPGIDPAWIAGLGIGQGSAAREGETGQAGKRRKTEGEGEAGRSEAGTVHAYPPSQPPQPHPAVLPPAPSPGQGTGGSHPMQRSSSSSSSAAIAGLGVPSAGAVPTLSSYPPKPALSIGVPLGRSSSSGGHHVPAPLVAPLPMPPMTDALSPLASFLPSVTPSAAYAQGIGPMTVAGGSPEQGAGQGDGTSTSTSSGAGSMMAGGGGGILGLPLPSGLGLGGMALGDIDSLLPTSLMQVGGLDFPDLPLLDLGRM